jgi:hypothetical protein
MTVMERCLAAPLQKPSLVHHPPRGAVHTYEFPVKALGADGAELATTTTQRKFPEGKERGPALSEAQKLRRLGFSVDLHRLQISTQGDITFRRCSENARQFGAQEPHRRTLEKLGTLLVR